MNILFIGHFYEKSGWGDAAKLYLKALLKTGHNVIARSIAVLDDAPPPSEEFNFVQECLNKELPETVDICIQNILPSFMSYYGGCKNVGLFFTETYNLKDTPWISNLSLMDELWCPNADMMLEFSYLPQPKKYVPCPIDIVDTTNITNLDLPTKNNYTFYFIGEFTRRKNVEALVKAFYREFHCNEPVSLVLKTYKYGMNDEEVKKALDSTVRHIQSEMRMYKTTDEYIKPILINQYTSRHDVLRLHKSCDCLVIPSCGEGTCLPAMDALLVGNDVVASDIGGLRDFIPLTTRVRGRLEPVFGHPTIAGFGTSRELWFSIDPLDLQAKMRHAYNSKPIRSKPNPPYLDYLSIDSVSNVIKGLIA